MGTNWAQILKQSLSHPQVICEAIDKQLMIGGITLFFFDYKDRSLQQQNNWTIYDTLHDLWEVLNSDLGGAS